MRTPFLKPAYLQVESSNTPCLEAHAGFFRLLMITVMKGILDPYVQKQKNDFLLLGTCIRASNYISPILGQIKTFF